MMEEKLQRAFAEMGHTHDLEDIVALVREGAMQSFVVRDTWAVTQILDFPKKRVLEVVLIVGNLDAVEEVFEQVFAFAKEQACDFVRAFGRGGWKGHALARGWQNGQCVFVKSVEA